MSRPLIAAALALATLTAPAYAGSSTFRLDVAYTKANLATPAGAKAEYARIQEQVADRCEQEFAELRYGKPLAVRACTRTTLNDTVRAISNANLSKVHANRV